MKNKFNTVRKYILDNSVKEYRKETVDGLFRSIFSPLLSDLQMNSCILLKLNDLNEKDSIIKRLLFSDSNIFSYNNNLRDFKIENSQIDSIWDNTEFAVILSQRYSAALMWDWELYGIKNKAAVCLLFNSKIITEIAKKIADNSLTDLKPYIQKFSPDRRENKALNYSISDISSLLNDKNEEIIFSEQEKNNILSNDETLKTADIVAQKAKYTAHEIKNNLSVINLYSTIIQKRLNNVSCDEENLSSIQNAIKNITSASENISSVINDLRCLAKPYITEESIKKIITNTIDMCKEKAAKSGVNIVVNDFEDCIIKTDKIKLRCVLTNIIYNAVEACKDSCRIAADCFLENGFVKIQIKNNGEKIPENIKNKIFEPNFTTKNHGSGLGLYICKKLLEETGGNIELLSSTEKETVFIISLPY